MTKLLYLQNAGTAACAATVMAVSRDELGLAVVLDVSPFYPKGGGQPSDVGWVAGPSGRMRVERVIMSDDRVLHYGEMVKGDISPGDRVEASIDVEVRRGNARLHTGGEVICAAVHELGKRWPVSAASHVPSQARVAFMADLEAEELPGFMAQLEHKIADIVGRDEPVLTFLDVPEDEVRRLCPLDQDGLASKTGGIRLVSPVRGFHRPCMGAHLASTGEVGTISIRKARIKNHELSISYEAA